MPHHIAPLIIDLEGTRLTPMEQNRLCHPAVGGVILFARNIESPEQLQALTQAIKQLRPDMMISVDQEGGRVQRLKAGVQLLPPMRTLGQLFDKQPEQAIQWAQNFGWLMASECRATGIDLSFAPVLDRYHFASSIIGNRAIHADIQVVKTLAQAFIQGMHDAQMPAVGKHFPSHAGVSLDSHVTLPEDTRDLETLLKECVPYAADNLDGIMMSHIRFSQVDQHISGYSKKWIKDILREQLNFKGWVVSDALDMAAATIIENPLERVYAALEAGCDAVIATGFAPHIDTWIDHVPLLNASSAQRWGQMKRWQSQPVELTLKQYQSLDRYRDTVEQLNILSTFEGSYV